MEVKATHKNARMSPRKIRPVGKIVRGLTVKEAEAQLVFTSGKAAKIINQVLKSAVANATNNLDMKEDELRVADVLVDSGLTFKRFNPVAKGMAHPILKRNSHVTVIVTGEAKKTRKRKSAREADIKTLSAGQFMEEAREKEAGKTLDVKKEKDGVAAKAKEERSIETKMDKNTHEAFQKKKMQQQGGDPKKTHRRKSI